MAMLLSKPVNENDHYLGMLNAPVTIVQYGDYECTICSRNHRIMKQIVNEFGNSICFAFRHFPLTYIHPHSALASVAAEVASLYGKFWEMHEVLMENQSHLSVEHILKLASDLGMDSNAFFHDLEDPRLMERVISDIMSGQDSEVESSPTYFVNGTKLYGIVNYESLRDDILHFLPESRAHY